MSAPRNVRGGLKLVAWETTRRCSLDCAHCRGGSEDRHYEGELSTEEGKRFIDSLAVLDHLILILTGGDPLMREDIFELAEYASKCGLRTVMAPCGHSISEENARRMKEAGIARISVSLDGATANTHDSFRGISGSFSDSLRGIEYAKKEALPFQINTTISRHNIEELEKTHDLAVELGAVALDVFMMVATGRGKSNQGLLLSISQYDNALARVADLAAGSPIDVKTTCAPQYARIMKERPSRAGRKAVPSSVRTSLRERRETQLTTGEKDASNNQQLLKEKKLAKGRGTGGCIGGSGFAFVSYNGVAQPCGFLPVNCGDLRQENYDFLKLYEDSPIYQALRDRSNLGGECGICEYARICGGCRARAYDADGDYLAQDPFCSYASVMERLRVNGGRNG